MVADGKTLHRMQVGDGVSDNPRIGGTSPELRFKDMTRDGIDAELIFPNLGMMTYAIDDARVACDACGGLLDVTYDWDRAKPPKNRDQDAADRPRSGGAVLAGASSPSGVP